MKTKIIFAILILALTTNASAREEYTRSNDNYAGRGALIGLAIGGSTGAAAGAFISNINTSEYGEGPSASIVAKTTVGGLLIGSAVGAGVGALIGSGIKKKHNYAVTPILNPDPESPGAGINLSVNF